MQKFVTLTSIAVPLVRDDIDTDAIIPSREMKSVSKEGLADGLFAGLRYAEIGGRQPNPDFILNDPAYASVRILLAGRNFGCGSSREHAVWALAEYGFRAIIAPSFNPIFRGNCIRNGVLPIELDSEPFVSLGVQPLTIDLPRQLVTTAAGHSTHFEIEDEAKQMLLEGFDAIDVTNLMAGEISDFLERDSVERPWVYL
jgi:3-isopropylmalate/(R)-2-methylmalate dehydratase small subunit